MILDDLLRKLRPLPRFVHLKPGVMNATNTIGAIEKALHSGMPAMSLRLHEILSIFFGAYVRARVCALFRIACAAEEPSLLEEVYFKV